MPDYTGDSFISRYMEWTKTQEASRDFHLWMAIATIASALGRNVYINMGEWKIYPNHYIILVAGSAVCRKSTAMDLATKLLSDGTDRRILSEKITPEALISQLSRVETIGEGAQQVVSSVPVTIFSDELGVFMSKHAQQSGLPLILTRFYACPEKFEYITKTSGTDRLRKICVNIIAGTTPSWLQRNLSPDVFDEGLVGRTLFIYADKPQNKNPFPETTKEQIILRESLINDLRGISQMRGEFTLDNEAKKFYADWYVKREPTSEAEVVSGFFEREHVHVLKVAMAFAISSGSGLHIYEPHISAAIDLLRDVRSNIKIVLTGAGFDVSTQHIAKVLREMEKLKSLPIQRSLLAKRLYREMNISQLDDAIDSLTQMGKLHVHSQGGTTYYSLLP